jgi:Cd2+/Zn2+-exporting ATPase
MEEHKDECCSPSQAKPAAHKVEEHQEPSALFTYLPAIASFVLLLLGLFLEHFLKIDNSLLLLAIYISAYAIVGWKTVWGAIKGLFKGEFFDERFLMSIATLGAFAIGEYEEGVAVMLFYEVGELFQHAAVTRAKRSIRALLDIRPDTATVLRDGNSEEVHPREVEVGEIIQMKPGEKVSLDGELVSKNAAFNTAALTGESVPQEKNQGEPVLAGMINLNGVAEVKVTTPYHDSKLSQILNMVQNAALRKAKTQLFISRFAKVYTPIVVLLAVSIALLPYFFVDDYLFQNWLYRALVFLVVSCPCGLVISIPLGYFGGIGAGSRNGILFKGSNFLDLMAGIDTIVTDKTGTLTKGVFNVQKVQDAGMGQDELLRAAAALETHSTHPIAKAVTSYASRLTVPKAEEVEEIAGHGLRGKVEGKEVLAGNLRLLQKFNIQYPAEIEKIEDTFVVVAVNGTFAGYITIADEKKEDAAKAIQELHRMGIKTVMLSGDKSSVVRRVASELGIDAAYGDLLPQDKVTKVESLRSKSNQIAFVGDGVNDAPVVALADVGIAMGGLGSDATIETSDVVIQNDQPSKLPVAIKISKATKRIVWQNISLALGVKVIVLCLGAGGLATLWEAVFADVGVALLAILNAVRIQKMNFS